MNPQGCVRKISQKNIVSRHLYHACVLRLSNSFHHQERSRKLFQVSSNSYAATYQIASNIYHHFPPFQA